MNAVNIGYSTPASVPTPAQHSPHLHTPAFRPIAGPSHSRNENRSQGAISRASLFCVRVVRADLQANGRICNVVLHNKTAFINIYAEHEATLPHVQRRVREDMHEEDLVLVGSTGLMFYDQDGTRGKLT